MQVRPKRPGPLRRRFALLVAIGLVGSFATTLVPSASAETPTVGVNTLRDGGVLRLHFDTSGEDFFRLDTLTTNSSGAITGSSPTSRKQVITTGTKCEARLTEATPSDPLGVVLASSHFQGGSVGQGTFPGLFADGFGIGGKGTQGNGQPCGRIDPGEVLSVKMPSGRLADYAELDLERKFGVTVKVELYLGGTRVGNPIIFDASGQSDDGPDSGDGDNFRNRIAASNGRLFDEIRIGPDGSVGSVSLEAGSDGTPPCDGTDDPACATFSLGGTLQGTMDSLFHLVEADGVLACGQTVTESNGGNTTSLTLENTSGCTPVPYSLEISGDGQEVMVRKDLTNNANAVFRWTVSWPVEPGQYPPPATTMNYGDIRGDIAMVACPMDNDSDGFPDLPVSSDDGSQSYCVASSAMVVGLTGNMTVAESYVGRADPLAKR